jgi:hypothetical protein
MKTIGNAGSTARELEAVASGTLPNGQPVVVNADGTVSVVGGGNLTSENYTATATIDVQGAINDRQSGLTAGQSYYVQTDGTLGTTPADPSVFAGTAISATSLIVKI